MDTIKAVHERLDGEPWRFNRTESFVPVMFTLADGRKVQSNHKCRRTEVAAYVAMLPRDIDVPLSVEDVEQTMSLMPLDHHA